MIARAWGARLRWHIVTYALLLVAVLTVLGTSSSINNDEGAYILQAKLLSSGQGWEVEQSLPTLDPSGEAFYVRRSEGGPTTFVYYGRHPLYPMLLAAADRVDGVAAMVLLSIAGAVTAAVAAAFIAGYLRAGTTRWAFWAAAVGSPLVFTSQQVIAHTLAAACAAWAAWAVVTSPGTDRRWLRYVVAMVLMVVGIMLRSEVALFAVALTLGSVLGDSGPRGARWARGALLGLAVPIAVAVDRLWVRFAGLHLLGGVTATDTGSSIVGGRINAVSVTLLRGPSDSKLAGLALVAMVVVVMISALLVRRDQMTMTVALIVGIVATTMTVIAATSSTSLVPGLLLVCPVLVAGVGLLDADATSSPARTVALWASGGFLALLLLVQYAQGGAIEWGPRFAIVALPLMIAVATVSVFDAGARLDVRVARRLGTALVLVSMLLAAMSVRSAAAYHRTITNWTQLVAEAVSRTPGHDFGDGNTRPVVVSSVAAFGRWMWPIFDSHRGIEISEADTCTYLERGHAEGLTDLVLVSLRSHQGEDVCGYRVVRSTAGGEKGRVYVEELVTR